MFNVLEFVCCFVGAKIGQISHVAKLFIKNLYFRSKIGLKTLILSFILCKCSKTYAQNSLKLPILSRYIYNECYFARLY